MWTKQSVETAAETLQTTAADTVASAENISKDLVAGSVYLGDKLSFAADRHAAGMENLATGIADARRELRETADVIADTLRWVTFGLLFAVAVDGVWRWIDGRRGE